jgi:hypothetical protein
VRVRSTVLPSIIALATAVVPNSIPGLVSRHAPLGTCDIDGELYGLLFGTDAHVDLHSRATSELRGGNSVITISKEESLVASSKTTTGGSWSSSSA